MDSCFAPAFSSKFLREGNLEISQLFTKSSHHRSQVLSSSRPLDESEREREPGKDVRKAIRFFFFMMMKSLFELETQQDLTVSIISPKVRSALSEEARNEGIFDTPETMFNFFIERVRSNLHIILCMSPVGDPFRQEELVSVSCFIQVRTFFVGCTSHLNYLNQGVCTVVHISLFLWIEILATSSA